jgi:hypothetical protein
VGKRFVVGGSLLVVPRWSLMNRCLPVPSRCFLVFAPERGRMLIAHGLNRGNGWHLPELFNTNTSMVLLTI